MRPLTLKLDFFGPFRHQTIDFTKFSDFPVFLISGKTGAGKTTIFDAMCFALFGGTSGGDRQVKQMRSDFATFEDETVVTFNFEHQGQTVRVVRLPEQEVAKKRGSGVHTQTAAVTLTVFDAAGQEVSELTKVNAVQAYIHDLLQLTRDQFSQIVLLPQGQFRQFLMANSDDKEKVLRDIFGTSLYRKWADDLRRELKQQQQANTQATQTLQTYQQQLTWQTLSADEAAELAPQVALERQMAEQATQQTQQTALKATLETAKKALQQAQQAQQVGQTLQKNHDQLAQLLAMSTQLKAQETMITDQRQTVKNLEWGQSLATITQQLETAQKQVTTETAAQKRLSEQQLSLTKQQTTATATLTSLASQRPDAEKRQALVTTLMAKRTFYEQAEQTKHALVQAEQTQTTREQAQAATQATLEKLTSEQTDLTKLSAQLPDLMTQAAALATQQRDLAEQQQQLAAVKQQVKVVDQAEQAVLKQRTLVDGQQAAVTTEEQHYQQLDSAWASEQIALLSQHLLPNQPCPVCGSTTHPQPAPTDTITVTEVEVKQAQALSVKAAKALATGQSQLTHLEENLATAQAQLQQLETTFKTAVGVSVVEAGALPTIESTLQQSQQALTLSLKANADQVGQAQQAQQRLTQLKSQLATVTEQQQEQTQAVTVAANKALQLKTQLADRQKQILPDYPTLTALETYLEQLKAEQVDYETAVEAANQAVTHVNDQLSAVKAQLATTQQHLTVAETTVTTAKTDLTTAMTAVWDAPDFDRLQQLLRQLPTLGKLRQQINDYDQQVSTLQGQLTTVKQAIADRPAPDLSALAAQVETTQVAEQQVEQQYYDLDRQLQANKTLVEKMQSTLAAVHDQQKKLAEISQLSQVANGNGAQKLSLERFVLQTYLRKVLQKGNQRLQQLTRGRYQFQLDTAYGNYRNATGLEINIYDDNAGKVRSVHTLSGGESFVAALSLALALAAVIQEQAGGIKIDALFIDEGFGSLDEEALEMAMETLQQVEGQSRMIGIISHVTELESQLPAQLQVIPEGNGESRVSYQLAFN